LPCCPEPTALALSLMHELIVHDWLDHDYIARYTLGWEALREHALQWPPERAAAVCGIPVEQITGWQSDYGGCLHRGEPPPSA
jgi:anaerobic selenocysteine-containing dehydrogenase